MTTRKTIALDLETVRDGNAFSLLGAFRKQAQAEGWSSTEILEILTEAQAGDYDHLIRTLQEYCD